MALNHTLISQGNSRFQLDELVQICSLLSEAGYHYFDGHEAVRLAAVRAHITIK